MRRQQTNQPMRRCIGCRTSYPQNELLRFTLEGKEIIPDEHGVRREGRGWYLCRNSECMEAAFRNRAFNRIAGRAVDNDYIRRVIEESISNTKED